MRRLIEIISSFLALLAFAPSLAFAQIGVPVDIRPDVVPAFEVAAVVKAVINLLFVVAAIVAIVFLIYGGIRWIVSGGDKSAVESARNTIIAAIIGLVIVFLSFVILSVVFQFFGIDLLTNFRIPTVRDPTLR